MTALTRSGSPDRAVTQITPEKQRSPMNYEAELMAPGLPQQLSLDVTDPNHIHAQTVLVLR